MAAKPSFTEEEMAVDEGLGYPKAYAQLCRSPNILSPYIHGPPYTFIPYTLQPQEVLRAKDLNQMFPVINPEATPSVNIKGYVNLLWKQLDHLGNAGFDPALYRIDPYGNVLYLYADSASPLAWEIDHWFPCSRGGKTVPSNLRLLQSQVCKKKQNKLDFLIPWWDLQLGISVNQFLSIFASRNSDFRNRAFSFLFSNGRSEELSTLQTVDSHTFPQHFISAKRQVGLAPAAIVSSQRSYESSVLKPLDLNRSLRPNSSLIVMSKENEKPNMDDGYNCNPHLSITMARDSLRQREESKKKQTEMNQLEDELSQLKQNNEAERTAIQELEEVLIKRRRRVEKCRRLAEAQASYKALLEKMIRDAMHQYVVYKEQFRLNQVATSTLMARLEAQRAICDSSENELRRKLKQRDEIDKQLRPSWEQARKRSRIEDTSVFEERHDHGVKVLPTRRSQKALKKELREFLEEARKASEAELPLSEQEEEEEIRQDRVVKTIGELNSSLIAEGNCSKTPALNIRCWQQEGEEEYQTSLVARDEISLDYRHKEPEISKGLRYNTNEATKSCSIPQSPYDEHEENHRRLIYSKNQTARDEISLDCRHKEPEISKGLRYNTNEATKSCSIPQSPYDEHEENHRRLIYSKNQKSISESFKALAIAEGPCRKPNGQPHQSLNEEDDEAYKTQVGKGNVDKWLQILLQNTEEESPAPPTKHERQDNHTEEIVQKLNLINPQKEIRYLRIKPLERRDDPVPCPEEEHTREGNYSKNVTDETSNIIGVGTSTASKFGGSRKSFEIKERVNRKEEGNGRCESSRGFRSLPSSPSVILGMKKGVDCMGKKPSVIDDEEDDNNENSVPTSNRFIKTCTRALKKAVNK